MEYNYISLVGVPEDIQIDTNLPIIDKVPPRFIHCSEDVYFLPVTCKQVIFCEEQLLAQNFDLLE